MARRSDEPVLKNWLRFAEKLHEANRIPLQSKFR